MEMRRKDRARDEAFSLALIDRCTHGVMALTTGTDTPYCLPLSLVRVDRALYFHCAHQGRKVELMRTCPKVCVTFIGGDSPAYLDKGEYTTYFQSAIVTGTVHEVTNNDEKILALRALCQKLTPQAMDGDKFEQAVHRSLQATGVWRIDLEDISGKEKAPKAI